MADNNIDQIDPTIIENLLRFAATTFELDEDLSIHENLLFAIAQKKVDLEKLCELASGDELALICIDLPNDMLSVLQQRKGAVKLGGEHLMNMAQHHPDVISYILSQDNLVAKLDRRQLVALGGESVEVARLILDNPSAISKLDGANLQSIGEKSVKIAELLLNHSIAVKKMDHFNIIEMCCSHVLESANSEILSISIYNNKEVLDKVKDDYLFSLLPRQIIEDIHALQQTAKPKSSLLWMTAKSLAYNAPNVGIEEVDEVIKRAREFKL